jgi:hypothetical protein
MRVICWSLRLFVRAVRFSAVLIKVYLKCVSVKKISVLLAKVKCVLGFQRLYAFFYFVYVKKQYRLEPAIEVTIWL